MSKKASFTLLSVLLFFVIFTLFSSSIDLAVAREVFAKNQFENTSTLRILFTWGPSPGWLLTIAAFVALTLSYFKPNWKTWRKPSLVVILTLAIGSGLIVHVLFKENWGRARPRQVIEFGGKHEFSPFYQSQNNHERSFPSGHATMGFLFLALCPIGRKFKDRTLFWTGLITGLSFGALIGLTRILPGGHFVSDIVMAGLIMWLTSEAVTYFIYKNEEHLARTC